MLIVAQTVMHMCIKKHAYIWLTMFMLTHGSLHSARIKFKKWLSQLFDLPENENAYEYIN